MNDAKKNAPQQMSEKRESSLRNIARMAEENAELVAVATMAFVNGLQIGSVRAAAEQQQGGAVSEGGQEERGLFQPLPWRSL